MNTQLNTKALAVAGAIASAAIGIVELGLVGALLGGVVGSIYNRFTKTVA